MIDYIIETSSLLEDKFISILKTLIEDKKTGCFHIDDSIKASAESYRLIGENLLADKISNIINLMESLGILKHLHKINYYNEKTLDEIEYSADLLVLVTQKESIYNIFKTHESDKFRLKKIAGSNLVFWEPKQQKQLQAFYVDDNKYINPVDTDHLDIKYVYSPRYGYLKVDSAHCSRGGEGICYRSYNNLFVKIYKSKHITYENFAKIKTMLRMDLVNPYIIWPKDIVYYEGDFVGYVMEELHDVVSIDELRDNGFPGFRFIDRFILCRDFLKIIHYLHEKNILVGDMKFDNIMVDKDKKVYLIDTGSFQIDDYACTVYNREFSSRVYHGNELKENLRMLEDEYFPINKIIFEILIQKNPYYSDENIEITTEEKQNFYFSIDKPDLNKVPMPHTVRWYNLSDNMRKFFYYYFKENKITLLSDWMTELEMFIKHKEKTI